MTSDDSKMKAIQVNLNARSRAVVERLRKETGIPNTEAMARLLEWYAEQDVGVRLAIMVQSTEDRQRLLRDAIGRWAAAEGKPVFSPLDLTERVEGERAGGAVGTPPQQSSTRRAGGRKAPSEKS